MDFGEYRQLFSKHSKSSPTGSEYIDSVDVAVDSKVAPLIRVINTQTEFITDSSCSGAVCDHFDIDGLREDGIEVSDEESFLLAFESVVPSEISVAIVDEWHQIQSADADPPLDTDVYVDGEFYDMQDALQSVLVEYESESSYGWPISVEYVRRMLPQWVYVTFSVPVLEWIREVDSFEEYDRKVESAVSLLCDVFSDIDGFRNGEWCALRYDISGSYWYQEERDAR